MIGRRPALIKQVSMSESWITFYKKIKIEISKGKKGTENSWLFRWKKAENNKKNYNFRVEDRCLSSEIASPTNTWRLQKIFFLLELTRLLLAAATTASSIVRNTFVHAAI